MTAEQVAVELTSPAGEAVRVVWSAEALGGSRPAERGGWRLEGELDWDEVEALRVVSAILPDRRILALASLRPAGAAGHGDDPIAAVLLADGSAEQVPDPLLSVEYGGDGEPRRIGLELYTDADALPLRVAADVTSVSREQEAGVTTIRAALEVRLDGKRAAGAYEVLTPAGAPAR